MSRNGSGTYSLPVGNPVVTGTTISSTWANNTLTDIANALTGSLSADGQTTASGNLNMGTNRIINLADPTSAQDGATKYYVDQLIAALGTMAYQNANNVAITGGTVTNVTLDLHQMTNQIYLPVGPTALRDAAPIQGIMRFNTDGPFYEGYVSGNWHRFLTVNEGSYTITYLAVGGGGGGGPSTLNQNSGGGGGKVTTSTTSVIPGTSILTMTIGAGGAAGSAGNSSTITGIVSATPGQPGSGNGGTSGNGYSGGSGAGPFEVGGGGGGGASAVGQNGSGGPANETKIGGAGGSGLESLITGTSQYFGGGGGGYGGAGSGAGGSGGGAAGGLPANNGSVNTGGGGGGPANGNAGGNGGSGVIYLSMPTLNYTGTFTGSPTVSTTGTSTVLKYTGSGTYTC